MSGNQRRRKTPNLLFNRFLAEEVSILSLQGSSHTVGSPVSINCNMQKTRKSVAKRFKITGTGKLLRRSPGQRHMMSSKSTKQKRRNGKDKLVSPGHAKIFMKTLPSGVAR